MAHISPAFQNSLDANPPKRPILGVGYKVEVWSRSAVRYTEGTKRITMFADFVPRNGEPCYGSALSKFLQNLFGKWCLGVYIEEPLVWDDDNEPVPDEQEKTILRRIQDAFEQVGGCYKIERGPNQQHSHGPYKYDVHPNR